MPSLLPPATKSREGNVFIPVSDSVQKGGLCQGGVSVQGGSLSRGVLVQGGSLSREGLCPDEVSVQGGSLSGRPPRMVTCGRYAFYWNAFF